MIQRLSLLAMTGLLAGASVFGLTQRSASADSLSIYIGPPIYVHYDDWRYHHDREYHYGYDRWRHEHDRGHHYGHDERGDGYRHEDRGYREDHHGDHGDHGDRYR
ncbi:MAG: hypothetical protein JWN27_190 [Candidatus Eremiobacteraeota bacterium]|nr:hypothetical protein [Candidatus Eremiobacteraeota bacterium]